MDMQLTDGETMCFETLSDVNWEAIMSETIKGTMDNEKIAQFKINHSLRVRDIVSQLALTEPEIDLRKAEAMALVHDMYRYSDEENHGKVAAFRLRKDYVEPYLKRGEEWMSLNMYVEEKEEWSKIYKALKKHSDKTIKAFSVDSRSNPYLRLIQDADVLDHLNIGYIEDYYELFYEPEENERMLLYFPLIKKYIKMTERYDHKCAGYKNVKLMMLEKLNTYAKRGSTENMYTAQFYEKEILKLLSGISYKNIWN